jgi:hypothetical protein
VQSWAAGVVQANSLMAKGSCCLAPDECWNGIGTLNWDQGWFEELCLCLVCMECGTCPGSKNSG